MGQPAERRQSLPPNVFKPLQLGAFALHLLQLCLHGCNAAQQLPWPENVI